MEILFESNTEHPEEFEYEGQIILNQGNVVIIKADEKLGETVIFGGS